MVALLALHIVLALWRSAFIAHATRALVSLVIYLVVIAVYAVMRIAKAVRDHKKAAEKAAVSATA